jgi:hypothetical protein
VTASAAAWRRSSSGARKALEIAGFGFIYVSEKKAAAAGS